MMQRVNTTTLLACGLWPQAANSEAACSLSAKPLRISAGKLMALRAGCNSGALLDDGVHCGAPTIRAQTCPSSTTQQQQQQQQHPPCEHKLP
eukprot:1158145-Pelagomonas_calceolata.AAC.4